MVDDRDDQYDEQEEGEYHFSDDQINYDTEAEIPKTDNAAVAKSSFKDLMLTKFTQHRRIILGSTVFLVLIGVIYKMVIPSSAPPVTDFTESVTTAAQTAKAPAKSLVAKPAVQSSANMQAAQQSPVSPTGMVAVPQQQAAMTQSPSSATAPMVSPIAAAAAQTAQPATIPGNNPPSSAETLSPMQQAQAAMMPQGAAPSQMEASQNQQPVEAQARNIPDRLASLEQQNAAMMNLLQTEYAQKISDYETQNTATRGKMEELTKRLNRMEAALSQITQLLREGGRSENSAMIGGAPAGEPARMAESKMAYSVQAIIPGRAWLKSESGDTVTVAEGDVLRSYGRVTKIDPYDGIVNIDTGNKVITLSYGISAE